MMGRVFLILTTAATLHLTSRGLVFAQSQNGDSMAALAMLQSFLFDANAMNELSQKDPAAKEANARLKAFPPWAQDEIKRIILQIMKEQGEQATTHVDAFEKGGGLGAYQSFSPEVQQAISKLAQKLQKDSTLRLSGDIDHNATKSSQP